ADSAEPSSNDFARSYGEWTLPGARQISARDSPVAHIWCRWSGRIGPRSPGGIAGPIASSCTTTTARVVHRKHGEQSIFEPSSQGWRHTARRVANRRSHETGSWTLPAHADAGKLSVCPPGGSDRDRGAPPELLRRQRLPQVRS